MCLLFFQRPWRAPICEYIGFQCLQVLVKLRLLCIWLSVTTRSILPSVYLPKPVCVCTKMGSDESHFNVSSVVIRDSHKTVSTNHNLLEEKREPKRCRTEVLPLTSLTPYRWANPDQPVAAITDSPL